MEFCLLGCRIRISVAFVTIVAVAVILDATGMAAWTVGSAFLHEMGHFLAFQMLGCPPSRIDLLPFGMRMETGRSLGYGKESLACLAGPAVNLLLFVLLSLPGRALGLQWAAAPAAVNLALGAFNLLPILPLDGGRTLLCLLCLLWEEKWADRVVCVISVAVLLPVAVLSFFLMLRGGANFTLLVTAVYLILLFLKRVGKGDW